MKNRLLINHEQDLIQLSWQPRQAAPSFAPAVSFEHPFDTQALAKLRWYLEGYLRYPYGIYPDDAAKIEQQFRVWGQQLFDLVFSRTEQAREFFQEATREGLDWCEIAIASDNPAVLNLPWELLYSSEHQFLAPLLAGIYRRVGNAHQARVQTEIGEMPQDKLNILLVIARPYGEQDVAFKTIARPMLEALKPIWQQVNLKVLRPPSFQEFERELNANKGFYHIVHFDGHGTVNAKGQGELVFESLFGTEQKITAEKIAQKLADCRVPVFVLNACKSAQEGEENFSSVAAQLILSGAKGVVAMAYSVYAETAKQFMGGLYRELARGASLAEAVAAARQMVLNQPLRPSPKGNLPLQDWLVPVLYQQETYTPFTLKPSESVILSDSEGTQRFFAPLRSAQNDICDRTVTLDLPEEGAYGFIGRDYDILRLERAFRNNHVGLLKGMGGVGKTELVCGFARWLDETQGRTGGIFFTSFEHGAGLSHVVNQIGWALWDDSFSQLMPEQQQAVVLEYLRTHPCLLIWDNFEPVAGFPTGNEPLLSDAERDNLKQFLKDLRGGQSWVLITSRREESWLEDCNYKRLALSGLSEQDVEEFAAKILQKVGVDRAKLPPDYLELLKLLGGHPFCLRVVLAHLKTQSPTELIEALRQGLDTFQGAEEEGREKSFTVSLDYSFAKLSDRTSQHLPFLAFFSNQVNIDNLHLFSSGSLIDVFGQAYQSIFGENLQKPEWLQIFKEAAEAGILEHLGESIYKIHPALPWYLRQCLSKRYSEATINELEKKLLLFYLFGASTFEPERVNNDRRATIFLLIEEPNLLQNLRLAEKWQNWNAAEIILRSLGQMYEQLDRRPEFRLLRKQALHQVGINLAEAKAKGQSAFEFWMYLQGIDANEAVEQGNPEKARVIHQEILDELTALKLTGLNDPSLNNDIAVANANLGMAAQVQRNFESAVDYYRKALQIFEEAGNSSKAATVYYELGIVARSQQDYEGAINYTLNALQYFENEGDYYRAAGGYYQLGTIAQESFKFEIAIDYYQKAIEIFEGIHDFYKAANAYHQMGEVARLQHDFQKAIKYYKTALQIYEDAQDLYNASDEYQGLGQVEKEQGNFESAEAYFKKAFNIRLEKQDWHNVAATLVEWGETLEAKQDWINTLKIYIQTLAIDVEHNRDVVFVREDIQNLGRMLKTLGESQFQAVWRYVTGKECSEQLLLAFRAVSKKQEK